MLLAYSIHASLRQTATCVQRDCAGWGRCPPGAPCRHRRRRALPARSLWGGGLRPQAPGPSLSSLAKTFWKHLGADVFAGVGRLEGEEPALELPPAVGAEQGEVGGVVDSVHHTGRGFRLGATARLLLYVAVQERPQILRLRTSDSFSSCPVRMGALRCQHVFGAAL